jgi:dTDP-4-dehydrorhamnose reductase
MRILLLGNTGQLGWELQRCLPTLGDARGLDYPEIDLAKPETLREIIRGIKPEVIVNAAAYTAVDLAENKHDLAYAINAEAAAVMAEEARSLDAALIHYSTDYVFDGSKGSAYIETDAVHPLNVYGASKLAGEHAIQSVGGTYLIFRTAWVYSLRRDSFVTKALGWARQNETLRLVDDQISNPTWARMLAEITAQILARGADYIRERVGLYHLAGDGFASRLEWARLILELDPNRQEQKVREILPAPTSDFPAPAVRPLFSALNCDRFASVFGLRLPPWQAALRLAMER